MYGTLPAKKYHYDIINQDYPKVKNFYFPYAVQFNSSIINKQKQAKFTFGCLGALIELKGFKQVITASKYLKELGYDFQVFIGGDGEQKQQLNNLIVEFQLEKYVKLIGRVEDKQDFFNKLDCFIFSSNKEDIGMVVPEAISYQVPMVANRIAFVSDLLTENEYLMAEADDLKNVENIWKAKPTDKIWWQVKTNYRFETELLNPQLLCDKMAFAIDNYLIMQQKAKNAYDKIKEYSMEKLVKKFVEMIK